MKIVPVVLSGGSGTRLWPMSRAALPKQLLPLVSAKSMLQETLLRLQGWPDVMPPLVVCGNDHRFLIAEQLREIDISPEAIVLEPVGRNTAPAVGAAALHLLQNEKDVLMLVLPADHIIQDAIAFQQAVLDAAQAAAAGKLATFGITPHAPETGYGYIRRGLPIEGRQNCHAVECFVEKPDLPQAEAYLASGEYYWNSGIFLFRPDIFVAELERFRPEIVQHIGQAYAQSYHDLDFCRLEESAFSACPADSVDYAVMEHTDLAVMVPVSMGWSDVGSWSALWGVLEKDADGNALRGDVYTEQVNDTLIRADNRMVAAIGVDNLLIVETADAVLVAHRDYAQDVKKVVDHLKRHGRCEHEQHVRSYRPWGWYEGIDNGDRFHVKRLMVKPGEKLSLQMHHHRAEHWVVVRGTARVTCGDKVELVSENQSTYIPLGTTHRLENPGIVPLHIIEVQSGSYLGEDDIVRFDDAYQRV